MFEPQVPAVSFSSDSLRVSFKGDQAVWDRLRKARVPPPPPPTHTPYRARVPWMQKVSPLPPPSKPAVGQNIALHAVPAYKTSRRAYLPSFGLPGSLNFIFPKYLQSSTIGMCNKLVN